MKRIEQIIQEEVRNIISEIIDDADEQTIDMFPNIPSTREERKNAGRKVREKEVRLKKARDLAYAILYVDGVANARLDDWNEQGSLQIVVELDLDRRNMPKSPSFNMANIKRKISKLCKDAFGFVGMIEMPKMKYDRSQFMGQRNSYKEGYDKRYIMIDYEF